MGTVRAQEKSPRKKKNKVKKKYLTHSRNAPKSDVKQFFSRQDFDGDELGEDQSVAL